MHSAFFVQFLFNIFSKKYLTIQKVNFIYPIFAIDSMKRAKKTHLILCAFFTKTITFFLHIEQTKNIVFTTRKRSFCGLLWQKSLSKQAKGADHSIAPSANCFYFKNPLMISSSASFSVRPRVMSLISCSPAIFPIAAS